MIAQRLKLLGAGFSVFLKPDADSGKLKDMKLICIVGPTAAGKTGLSIEIAREVNGEIISADSRQVYRGLDLGTGKVTLAEMKGVPHHLIDVAEPGDIFSAADFVRLGRLSTYEVDKRGRIPIIVGGTGFYIDTLLGRRTLAAVPPNKVVRFQLSGFSLDELKKKLKELDPERFETIDTKNPRRLVRAIEIAQSAYPESWKLKVETSFEVLWLGLAVPHAELKKKIQARLSARLEAGMLEEAKRLHAEGLSFERMEALGLEYRSMARHLQGKISYGEMVLELEKDIAAYAKRQMTWFRNNKDIQWFDPSEKEKIMELVKNFVK